MASEQAARIITVHSFRRGTGKTTITASLAALLAATGKCVGVIEVGAQLPSLHYAFGLGTYQFEYTLQDYLHNRATITQAAQEIKPFLKAYVSGSIHLALTNNPTSPSASQSPQVDATPSDAIERLGTGFYDLIDVYHLDYLLLDTNSGISDEAILALNLADFALVLLRPDQQDYQGTATAVQLYRQFETLQTLLVLNAIPSSFDLTKTEHQLAVSYQASVGAVLPFVPELSVSDGAASYVLRNTKRPFTNQLQHLIQLFNSSPGF